MKILILSDVYFPRVNGVSTSIQIFRRELGALGHPSLLVAPEYAGSAAPAESLWRVPSRRVPFDPEDRLMRAGELMKLLPDLRRQQFDLVHVQTPFVAHHAGVRIARALDLPCVETYHTLFEEYLFHYIPLSPPDALRRAARYFSRRQCNRMDGLVVPSRAMEQRLRGYGVTVPISVIPTGMPADAFVPGVPASFRVRYGIDPERPVLLYVGRVAFEKNIDFLLRMLVQVRVRVPNVLLVIAGEGPARRSLMDGAARLGLQNNTLFVGYLSRGVELASCYQAADAFVFASRTETQGLVLLEAMALGVPVVSTAIMGTVDILEPRRGALVAEDDETDFAAQTIRLLQDRGLRDRLGEQARAYAMQEWSARRSAERMVEHYWRLTGMPTAVEPAPEPSVLP